MDAFHALVLSLPTRNSTLRMRVWRALKETGCGVLRDGVYVLPAEVDGTVLEDMATEIRAEGGFALTLDLKAKRAEHAAGIRKRFDRGKEYGELVQKITAAKAALARLGSRRGLTA